MKSLKSLRGGGGKGEFSSSQPQGAFFVGGGVRLGQVWMFRCSLQDGDWE